MMQRALSRCATHAYWLVSLTRDAFRRSIACLGASHRPCSTADALRAPVKCVDQVAQLRRHDLGKHGVVARRRGPHVHEAKHEQCHDVQRDRHSAAVLRQALHQQQAERDAHAHAELARQDAPVVRALLCSPVADGAANDAAQRGAGLEEGHREGRVEVRETHELEVEGEEDEGVPGGGAEDALDDDDLEGRDARHLQPRAAGVNTRMGLLVVRCAGWDQDEMLQMSESDEETLHAYCGR